MTVAAGSGAVGVAVTAPLGRLHVCGSGGLDAATSGDPMPASEVPLLV